MIKWVNDVGNAWRWFSMQAMVLALAVQGAWAVMPADLKAYIPETWVFTIAITLLIAGIVGRLVDQQLPTAPKHD